MRCLWGWLAAALVAVQVVAAQPPAAALAAAAPSERLIVKLRGSAEFTAQEAAPAREQGLKALVRSLKDGAEMEAIADALEKTHWCRKDAAKLLGISYKALLYKIRQYGIAQSRSTHRLSAGA